MDIEMRILGEEVEVGRILKYAFAWGGSRWEFDGSLYFDQNSCDFFRKKESPN